MQKIIYPAFLLAFLVFKPQAQTLTLLDADEVPNAKSISVTIGGSFFLTGTFSASPTERVDQFITRICAKGQKGMPENNSFSKRAITLKRVNGETKIVDLLKFQVTGNYQYNPYLKNEDVLIFPPLSLDYNFISIAGAVNNPQTFQFVEGDRLSDIILLAQGINPAYENVTKALLNRLSVTGNKEEEDTVLITSDLFLKRGDRIKILAEEIRRKDYKIFIDGEVFHPGYVPITKDSTTLKMVLEKAGGIKPSADLNRAELIRGANVFRSTLFSEEFEKMLMARMSTISYEDSSAFAIDNKLRILRGNGTINFHRAMDPGSNDGNFIVKTGDYIFIPELVDLVYVFGQVKDPGYVKYQKGETIDYYLQKADGVGIMAKSEIYLIKGKTRVWARIHKGDGINIESGDFIWVPKKPVRYFSYYLQQAGTFTSILGSVATLILLLIQFSK
jgi:protein involved in polysaccharide export with SLBB domain